MELSQSRAGVMNRMRHLMGNTTPTGIIHSSKNRLVADGRVGGDKAMFGHRHDTDFYIRMDATRPLEKLESLELSPEAAKHCVYERGVERCSRFGF